MKLHIGIDIGSDGAFATFFNNTLRYGKLVQVAKGEQSMYQTLAQLYGELNTEPPDEQHCVIEQLKDVYGSSSKSNFAFGKNVGRVLGMLDLMQIPFTQVSPQTWQKEMWLGVSLVKYVDKKEKDREGNPKVKTDTKATSLIAARRLFPKESFLATERSSVPHDGIVDAVLLCEFCRRHF